MVVVLAAAFPRFPLVLAHGWSPPVSAAVSTSSSFLPFHVGIPPLSLSLSPPPSSDMMKKLLTKSTKSREKAPSAFSTLEKLHETLEMLEKKEQVLQKKVSKEVEKARDYAKLKNKKASIQCLKKKKMYEAQIEQLGNFQLRVHDQMILLEGSKATTDTVDALRTGSAAIKSIHKSLSIDDIDETMEKINEHGEHMKQIQEALATPVGASAEFDEDELEAELEELEEAELEEQLLSPPSTETSSPLPTPRLPNRAAPLPATAADMDELTALQAEMAM